MTQVNCVPPGELTRRELSVENAVLPAVLALAERAWRRGEAVDDSRNPTSYVFGTGHLRFFYSRLGYLRSRHRDIRQELLRRGFRSNLNCDDAAFDMPDEWQRQWSPSDDDMRLNRYRLADGLARQLAKRDNRT